MEKGKIIINNTNLKIVVDSKVPLAVPGCEIDPELPVSLCRHGCQVVQPQPELVVDGAEPSPIVLPQFVGEVSLVVAILPSPLDHGPRAATIPGIIAGDGHGLDIEWVAGGGGGGEAVLAGDVGRQDDGQGTNTEPRTTRASH